MPRNKHPEPLMCHIIVQKELAVAVINTGLAVSSISERFINKHNTSKLFTWEGLQVQVVFGQVFNF